MKKVFSVTILMSLILGNSASFGSVKECGFEAAKAKAVEVISSPWDPINAVKSVKDIELAVHAVSETEGELGVDLRILNTVYMVAFTAKYVSTNGTVEDYRVVGSFQLDSNCKKLPKTTTISKVEAP